MFGAIIWMISDKLETPKSVVYAISGGTIASFTIGGIGLYLDWFRWVVPGIIDLKGSYVMLDQGLTGLNAATFPTWLALLFLSLYPFWFAVGYEHAKKHRLEMKWVPILMVGVLLLLIPSVIESQFLAK
jgi:hypothetical protein